MGKVSRTFRIENDISRALTSICERHGDATWHVEKALSAYGPIKKLLAKPAKSVAIVKQVEEIPQGINLTAWGEWSESKGNITKGAKTKQWKLLLKYSESDQQLIIDASINAGWKGLFDLKGRPQQPNKDFVEQHTNNDWRNGL